MAFQGAAAGAPARGRAWAAVLLAVAIYLLLAVPFAGVQEVWIDESTQLLGARLPLGRLFAWLAGAPEALGVPPDRMPPLGYLVDWTWQRVGGTDPVGFRFVHLAFAAAGVGLTTAVAARRYGLLPALVTGLLLALSPGLVTVGVEIRAYPLFLAATAMQLWLLARLCDPDRPAGTGALAGFAAAGLVAIYVHFFGLVSSSALFVGLLAARARDRNGLLRIAGAWGAVLVLAAGILPFVGGARAISGEAVPVANDLAGVFDYLPRIYGHAAMLLYPTVSILLFAGFAALLAIGAGRAVFALEGGRWRAPAGLAAALAVALLAGGTATVLAGFLAHGFDPMKPSYSVWMVPVAALLAGSACAGGSGRARAAQVVALVTVLALLPVTATFARRSGWFVHGPEAALAQEIGPLPAGTALVYVGSGWGYGYFPLVHRYGGALAQYRLDEETGALHPLHAADPGAPPVPPAALDRFRRLVVARITPRTGDDLRALEAGTVTDGFDTPPLPLPGWHAAGTTIRPGLYWLQLSRWERNRPS